MTKVKIIVEATPIQKKKPIEFVKVIKSDCITTSATSPHMWNNVELICKNYSVVYDLMFAYNKHRGDGMAYLGHFNDGIVEEEVTND